MNIFVIPSWFPSKDHPISGVMIKEQTEAFCRFYPSVNIGISVWGQQEEAYLLWIRDHVKNLKKLIFSDTSHYSKSILPNLKIYSTPTFTWSRKLLAGNFKNVVKANLNNLEAFEREFGSVDVIHAHVGFPAGLIAMEVAKKTGKPYCLTEHMGPFPWPHTKNRHGKMLKYYKQPYLEAAMNIAVSPYQATLMEQNEIKNVAVIPNFVNENLFFPKPAEQSPAKEFSFFSMSFIAPNKGTDVLIHAAHILLQRHKKISFRVGGAGPFLSYCQALATRLGVASHFTWLGVTDRETAIREFQQCDAFVLPSQYESMGIVYVEAIACGKPIVATQCGGPETIVNPQNGVLVEINNPSALAEGMEQVMLSRSKYDYKIIRSSFLEKYSVQAVAPQLLELYKSLT